VLFARSRDLLLKGMPLDPNDALTYSLLSVVNAFLNDWDRSVAMADKTLDLNPNDRMCCSTRATSYLSSGGRKRLPR
jgi:hypothetical protein